MQPNLLVLLLVLGDDRYCPFNHADFLLLQPLVDLHPELEGARFLDLNVSDDEELEKYGVEADEVRRVAAESSDYLDRAFTMAHEQYGQPVMHHLVEHRLFSVDALEFLVAE